MRVSIKINSIYALSRLELVCEFGVQDVGYVRVTNPKLEYDLPDFVFSTRMKRHTSSSMHTTT